MSRGLTLITTHYLNSRYITFVISLHSSINYPTRIMVDHAYQFVGLHTLIIISMSYKPWLSPYKILIITYLLGIVSL
jgi:hypothetical protein